MHKTNREAGMSVGIADRGRYSAEEFCKNLLGVLVLSGLYEIPIGDPSVEKAFGRIVIPTVIN